MPSLAIETQLPPNESRQNQVFRLEGTPEAFGRIAVDAALLDARSQVMQMSDWPTSLLEKTEVLAEDSLRETRMNLFRLSGPKAQLAATLLEPTTMPSSLIGAIKLKNRSLNRPLAVLKRLTAIDNEGEYLVPDETFLNVLEWHNHQLSQKQDYFSQEILPIWGANFNNRMAKAVDEGWMPPAAIKNMDRLYDTKIWLDDGWNTKLKGYMGLMTLKSPGRSMVEIAPGAGEIVMDHELLHVLEGREIKVRSNASTGLYRLFENDTMIGFTLNEAVVEHMTQSLAHGEVDKIVDRKKFMTNSSYEAQRKFLDVLANKGYHKIDVRLFIAAHFESQQQREELGDKSALNQLEIELRHAWPMVDDVIQLMSEREPSTDNYNDPETVMQFGAELKAQADKYRNMYHAGRMVGKVLRASKRTFGPGKRTISSSKK